MKKAKKHVDAEEFAPFKRYLDNRDALTKHLIATELAYALAVCSLSDGRLKATDPVSFEEADSFSKADFGIKSVERIYGWVTLAEYAALEKISLRKAKGRLDRGELGKAESHPSSNLIIVMWPTSKYDSAEAKALKLGMSQWAVKARGPSKKVGVKFDSEDEHSLDQARETLLFLGRELGDSHSIYTEAQELFYRGSFLNLWSTFEGFIKDAFGDLVRRFPLSLAVLPDWKKLSLPYSELVIQTNGLEDISSLRELLIGAEIAKSETGGRSISGLINLLKWMFDWPADLYERPYRVRGKVLQTGYRDLNEIREVRNALVHQHIQQPEIFEKSNRLRLVEGRPVIDKHYLDWAQVVMSSIAYGISEDVIGGHVSVAKRA